MLSSVLGWVGLGPGVSDDPLVPVQSPALWAVLAWVRRQGERSLAGDTPALGSTPTQTGLTIDDPVTAGLTAAAADQGAQQAAPGTSMAALSAPVTINDPVTADLTAAAADQGAEQAAAGTSMAALSAPVTIDDPVTADLTAAAGDKGAEQAAAGTSMAALSAPVTIDVASSRPLWLRRLLCR